MREHILCIQGVVSFCFMMVLTLKGWMIHFIIKINMAVSHLFIKMSLIYLEGKGYLRQKIF